MQEKSTYRPAEDDRSVESPPVGGEKPSYYYDDAHGYEVFEPTDEDEEDEDPC